MKSRMSNKPVSRVALALIAFAIIVGFNLSLAWAFAGPWHQPIVLSGEAVLILAVFCMPRAFRKRVVSACSGCIIGAIVGYVFDRLGIEIPKVMQVSSWVPIAYAFGFVLGCLYQRSFERAADATSNWIHVQLGRFLGK